MFTAALQSFSHGTNDAQKSMGIITLALIVANLQDPSNVEPVLWVKIACATAMGLGTAIGGWKIIKTVGGNIMKIRPANGAAADLSSALTIFVASSLHFPLSTTHVVSSSILGVGASNRAKGVKVEYSSTYDYYMDYYIANFCYFSSNYILDFKYFSLR